MALDIIRVEGCYMSSSLPKALFVPVPSPYRRNKRDNLHSSNTLHFRPKTRSTEEKPARLFSSNEAPVEGRQHLAVQTDLYLEELCDVVEEADAQCETDPFLDRPPSPLFVPAKSGVDAETQIYPGELFDFDEEVEPVLEALVEQTLEQALLEISAEKESATSDDLKRRNSQAEGERLEELDQRQSKENETKIKEHEETIFLEDEVAQKIVACIFSQNYLSELVPQVYKKLEVEGYFDEEDPEMQEMEETFWPWLMNEVDSEIATLEASCQLLDTLIDDTDQNTALSENADQNMAETHQPSDMNLEEEENASDEMDLKTSANEHEVIKSSLTE